MKHAVMLLFFSFYEVCIGHPTDNDRHFFHLFRFLMPFPLPYLVFPFLPFPPPLPFAAPSPFNKKKSKYSSRSFVHCGIISIFALHRYDFSFALSLTGTFGPPKEER
jgi:hypothetical protein